MIIFEMNHLSVCRWRGFWLLVWLHLCAVALGQSPFVAVDRIEEGVYSLYSHEKMPEERRRQAVYFQSTILELKDGHYRYWFNSDAKMPGEQLRYPLEGTYTVKGDTITMSFKIAVIQMSPNDQPRDAYSTETWKALKYEGENILWPMRLLGPPKPAGPPPHNVLVRTKRDPAEIWKQER